MFDYVGQRQADNWLMKAHDVRDVSARIYLAAEELSKSADTRTRLLGERVLLACDRIVDICESSTRKHVERCQCSVTETMQLLADLAECATGPKTRIHIHVGCEAQLRRDGVSLFRILANLVNNAVTAVNDAGGGSVIIRSAEVNGKVTFFVENCATNPLPETEPDQKSSGLGLLIACGLSLDVGACLEQVCDSSDGVVFSLQLDHSMAIPHGREDLLSDDFSAVEVSA